MNLFDDLVEPSIEPHDRRDAARGYVRPEDREYRADGRLKGAPTWSDELAALHAVLAATKTTALPAGAVELTLDENGELVELVK